MSACSESGATVCVDGDGLQRAHCKTTPYDSRLDFYSLSIGEADVDGESFRVASVEKSILGFTEINHPEVAFRSALKSLG